MKILTAPNDYEYLDNKSDKDIFCFLAGGITDCYNWQDRVIKKLKIFDDCWGLDNLVVCNPRRKNFPIDKQGEATKQIKWEYFYLTTCDIFSMYFCGGRSVQPICLYELGSYTRHFMNRYGEDVLNHIIVSCENEYSRKNDVIIQSELLLKCDVVNRLATPHKHAKNIALKYLELVDLER